MRVVRACRGTKVASATWRCGASIEVYASRRLPPYHLYGEIHLIVSTTRKTYDYSENSSTLDFTRPEPSHTSSPRAPQDAHPTRPRPPVPRTPHLGPLRSPPLRARITNKTPITEHLPRLHRHRHRRRRLDHLGQRHVPRRERSQWRYFSPPPHLTSHLPVQKTRLLKPRNPRPVEMDDVGNEALA